MARARPAPGQQFETQFTEVYTPIEGCLVGEAMIRLAGFSPTTLVGRATAFQQAVQPGAQRATAAASPAGLGRGPADWSRRSGLGRGPADWSRRSGVGRGPADWSRRSGHSKQASRRPLPIPLLTWGTWRLVMFR